MKNYSIVLCILEVKHSKPKELVFKEKRTGFGFLLIWLFISLKLLVKYWTEPLLQVL